MSLLRICVLVFTIFSTTVFPALSSDKPILKEAAPTAPYLLPNASTFDTTLIDFRAKYNKENPELPLNEYRSISIKDEETPITRAATRINDTLYSSVVLEKGTAKIKSLQITYLPPQEPDVIVDDNKIKSDKKNTASKKAVSSKKETALDAAKRELAVNYMAAIMRFFAPTLSQIQSINKINALLAKGKGKAYYDQTDGALRYIISDSTEKGITFAVEPIKLLLSEEKTANKSQKP